MKRHALFVGVNSYNDQSIRWLRYSIPDASVLADRFKGLGYKTRLLPDPTEAELKKAILESVDGLGRGDVFLFFFAGHGFTAQDGAHLLFCRDSIQVLLRVNGSGVKVDALEALTDKGGFHRAFLLDSCRTDCFAGVEGRGGITRDLDFVAMPKCTQESGSFFLLRSCDKFCPSLEFDSIGHGLFTQGLLDAMDAHDGRLAGCDTSFAEAVRAKMADIQIGYNVLAPQRPSIGECSGPVFSLFDKDFLTTTAKPTSSVSPAQARRAADEKARREAEKKVRFATLPKTGDVRKLILPGGAEMEMIYCPPGEFMMGSPSTEGARYDDENLHHVRLTKGFWLGKGPVTQGQWQSVMGSNPSKFVGDQLLPVDSVSWDDCREFIGKVAGAVRLQLDGEACFPTEAEWEYACRAGTTTAYSWGGCLKGDMANCNGKYPYGVKEIGANYKKTTPVGCYGRNAWGLCDLHGNVWEWCADWYGEYVGDAVDPTGPDSGTARVLRGGSWCSHAQECRSARRSKGRADKAHDRYGFRLCCSAST